ncbi:MAG TPA: DNA repair exonuclease [Candidatus Dormibacteraeota bacterium]|nr:DNA repair exonuclease [Candidatus Dormibacteraeota bacterium]
MHSADWQLGMWREQLSEEAQARFGSARIDGIRRIGQLALEVGAQFVVVAGDVFESNHLDRSVIRRSLDAMGEAQVPIYLLPGNHDPLQPGGVFNSKLFREESPENVHVLRDTGPVHPLPGVELVGVPWLSKRPAHDPVGDLCAALQPVGGWRIVVAHGAVDVASPAPDNPELIRVGIAEQAIRQGRLHYLALGDRHSTTSVGSSGAIWYSGAHEPTRFSEVDPGNILVVELGEGSPVVAARRVGTWAFTNAQFTLAGPQDLAAVFGWLEDQPAKDRTLVRLTLVGTLSIQAMAEMEARLEEARELFAAVRLSSLSDLALAPDESDFSGLNLSGFAATAADKLRARAETGDQAAADALALLFRLARSAS